MYKVIVAHPYQQHSYRTAIGLERKGMLFKYITTIYQKPFTITHFLSFLLPKKYRSRAKRRSNPEIPKNKVLVFNELLSLFRLLCQNIKFLNKYHDRIRYKLADRFAKKVAKYAIKLKVDAVITYDDCSPLLFEILKKRAPQIKRILDVSAANRLYMKLIYENDFLKAPDYKEKLKNECKQCFDEELLARIRRELLLSDYYLCPSFFVKKSLLFCNFIEEKQIKICPYGSDKSIFYPKKDYKYSFPLQFVYVGGFKALKGVFYMLEAFKSFTSSECVLTFVGNYEPNNPLLSQYKNVRFTGLVSPEEVSNILRNSDVFIMPSLGEGLSLSCIEAASCGLPVVASENSGYSDFILDGQNGFVFPIQNIERLEGIIRWFVNNPDKIQEIGVKSKETADLLSWDNYYLKLTSIITDIITKL